MTNTVVLEHTPIMPGLEHPSLPGETIPAVLTGQPAQRDICPHCVWLARMIRADRHVEDYGWLAIQHVAAFHPEFGYRDARERDGLAGEGTATNSGGNADTTSCGNRDVGSNPARAHTDGGPQ